MPLELNLRQSRRRRSPRQRGRAVDACRHSHRAGDDP